METGLEVVPKRVGGKIQARIELVWACYQCNLRLIDLFTKIYLFLFLFQGGIWDDRDRREKDCESKICWAEDWLRMADGGEPTQLKEERHFLFSCTWS